MNDVITHLSMTVTPKRLLKFGCEGVGSGSGEQVVVVLTLTERPLMAVVHR